MEASEMPCCRCNQIVTYDNSVYRIWPGYITYYTEFDRQIGTWICQACRVLLVRWLNGEEEK